MTTMQEEAKWLDTQLLRYYDVESNYEYIQAFKNYARLLYIFEKACDVRSLDSSLIDSHLDVLLATPCLYFTESILEELSMIDDREYINERDCYEPFMDFFGNDEMKQRCIYTYPGETKEFFADSRWKQMVVEEVADRFRDLNIGELTQRMAYLWHELYVISDKIDDYQQKILSNKIHCDLEIFYQEE